MEKSEIIALAGKLLSDSKTAVLSTIKKNGHPAMRWMTPVFLDNFNGYIFAVTSYGFDKAGDIEVNDKVQWMFQDKTLNTVINFYGRVNIVDNLSLKTEVLEAAGRHLGTFWTLNEDPSSLIVLETEILSATVFYPSKGKKYSVAFGKEG